jgi:hypothetical protein
MPGLHRATPLFVARLRMSVARGPNGMRERIMIVA